MTWAGLAPTGYAPGSGRTSDRTHDPDPWADRQGRRRTETCEAALTGGMSGRLLTDDFVNLAAGGSHTLCAPSAHHSPRTRTSWSGTSTTIRTLEILVTAKRLRWTARRLVLVDRKSLTGSDPCMPECQALILCSVVVSVW
jgi:hypothetical protein